ncbi:MAG: hypothetical protein HOQ19_12465 [Gemmatimonadaceae bacterium]|nr:hypothetical protein [Gemmatimonadaceae bacterium]
MLDDMNTQGNRSSSGDKPQQRAGAERQPLTDREVPLGQSRTSASIHAWLDGEVPESAVRTAETARDVDFWRKVTEETERRRAMRTPAHLEAQIMAALPMETADGPTTWWRKDVTMTPATAAVAAASLLAAGAVATVAVLRALR